MRACRCKHSSTEHGVLIRMTDTAVHKHADAGGVDGHRLCWHDRAGCTDAERCAGQRRSGCHSSRSCSGRDCSSRCGHVPKHEQAAGLAHMFVGLPVQVEYMAQCRPCSSSVGPEDVCAGAKPSADGAAEGAPAAAKPKVEEADAPLPPGWARAKDQQGRTYYWHTQVRAQTHLITPPAGSVHLHCTTAVLTTCSGLYAADEGRAVAAAKVVLGADEASCCSYLESSPAPGIAWQTMGPQFERTSKLALDEARRQCVVVACLFHALPPTNVTCQKYMDTQMINERNKNEVELG
jgi:hypothetical protein